jgi:hypothetical protein
VPEAAIDEHRDSRSGEDDVTPDRPTIWESNREVDPESAPGVVQRSADRQLRVRIPPAIAHHYAPRCI